MEEGRGGPKVIRSIDRAARLQRVLSNLVDFCVCVSLLLFFHSFVVVNGYMWESRKEDKCLPIKRQPLWTDAIQLMANNQSGSNLCSWLSIDSIPTNQRDKDYVQLQFANAYNQRGLRMALMLDEYFLTSIARGCQLLGSLSVGAAYNVKVKWNWYASTTDTSLPIDSKHIEKGSSQVRLTQKRKNDVICQ